MTWLERGAWRSRLGARSLRLSLVQGPVAPLYKAVGVHDKLRAGGERGVPDSAEQIDETPIIMPFAVSSFSTLPSGRRRSGGGWPAVLKATCQRGCR